MVNKHNKNVKKTVSVISLSKMQQLITNVCRCLIYDDRPTFNLIALGRKTRCFKDKTSCHPFLE